MSSFPDAGPYLLGRTDGIFNQKTLRYVGTLNKDGTEVHIPTFDDTGQFLLAPDGTVFAIGSPTSHDLNGGAPNSASARVVDGGSPTSISTNTYDGGTP